MKNIVTFDTARRLKEAGFPQPEPEAGQFWYTVDRKLAIITHSVEHNLGFTVFNGLHEVWYAESVEIFNDVPFAPAATDILTATAKLVHPNLIRVDISTYSSDNSCEIQEPQFFIYSFPYSKIAGHQFYDNPAEAAALAWLALNEKQ